MLVNEIFMEYKRPQSVIARPPIEISKPVKKPKFTEMELAIMEGGHSIEDYKQIK